MGMDHVLFVAENLDRLEELLNKFSDTDHEMDKNFHFDFVQETMSYEDFIHQFPLDTEEQIEQNLNAFVDKYGRWNEAGTKTWSKRLRKLLRETPKEHILVLRVHT